MARPRAQSPMSIYLYCTVPAEREQPSAAPPLSLRGIDGVGVRLLPVGPVAAWVSDIPEDRVAPSIARARAHDGVVRAALSVVTPLPARFGQVLASDEQLSLRLTERRELLLSTLDRVRGCVEITVRILLAGGGEPAGAAPHESGSAYLRWVRQRQQARHSIQSQAEFLRERVARVLEGGEEGGAVGGGGTQVVREALWASTAPDSHSLEAAHLVPRDMVARHRAVMRTVVERESRLRLVLSGPCAPYTFCPAML